MDVNTMLPPMTVAPIPMTFANLGAFSPVILERLYQCIEAIFPLKVITPIIISQMPKIQWYTI